LPKGDIIVKIRASFVVFLFLFSAGFVIGQSKSRPSDKFRQMDQDLPTPNEYRTASGAPGNKYWQQRADYVIDVELDDVNQRISGNVSKFIARYAYLPVAANRSKHFFERFRYCENPDGTII
jgi:hypothetical protein